MKDQAIFRRAVKDSDVFLHSDLITVARIPEDGQLTFLQVQFEPSGSEATVFGVVHQLRQLQDCAFFQFVVCANQDVVHAAVLVFAVDIDCGFIEGHRQQVTGEGIAGGEEDGQQGQQ